MIGASHCLKLFLNDLCVQNVDKKGFEYLLSERFKDVYTTIIKEVFLLKFIYNMFFIAFCATHALEELNDCFVFLQPLYPFSWS